MAADGEITIALPREYREQALRNLEIAKAQEKKKIKDGYRWVRTEPQTMRLIKAEK